MGFNENLFNGGQYILLRIFYHEGHEGIHKAHKVILRALRAVFSLSASW